MTLANLDVDLNLLIEKIICEANQNSWTEISIRGPHTIQQDIHPNIRLAENSPAGYSPETILLPITQKIKHYGKNESYLTQWHTKCFQNIKLVLHYSKSVSRENSKCLHFASVQMKHIVQDRPFFSSQTE